MQLRLNALLRKLSNYTKKRLSKAGKEWVDLTTLLLQQKLETELSKNSNLECCGLRKAAFDSHPDAYVEGGLAGLGFIDKMKILGTVDDVNEIDMDAIKQMLITVIYVIGAVQQ